MTDKTPTIVNNRWEAKVKGDKIKVRFLNANVQWLARKVKNNYYSNQCRETEQKIFKIEVNNERGEIKDLFHKILEIKKNFKPRMGMLKDQIKTYYLIRVK